MSRREYDCAETSKFIHDKTEVVVEPHRGCDFRTVMKYAKLVG